MIQRFAVEFDRRVVGIAVRVPGGFMFFASDDHFEQLDGQLFPRARAISRHLEKLAKRSRAPAAPRMRAAAPSPSRAAADVVPSGEGTGTAAAFRHPSW